jgi:4-alpha-glucanotransferase
MSTTAAPIKRTAGLLVPLFSIPSSESWGIGEAADLPVLARWLREAAVAVVQLLPINEMAAGQTSPYSAISAMAIDPIFISMREVGDFLACGGESRLPLADQAALRSARSAPRVDHAAVRRAKESALQLAFSMFWEAEWVRGTGRAGAFAAYCSFEEWWLADYALYRALRDRFKARSWTDWDAPLRDRDPGALDAARRELEREVLYYQYLQWIAEEQWQDARAASKPVRVFGDFPFMVSTDSADVWARQDLFRFDRTVGVPPDAFSATGQEWGLPVYRWDRMVEQGDGWLRERARRTARLFDGYRIDHLVGFYRTYSRPLGEQDGEYDPLDQPSQVAQGERLMDLFIASGARIVAEDLGSVPEFVRESITRLGLPGYKVLRWERDWDEAGQPFRDPAGYPALAVATTGTHDTDPNATWWETADEAERKAFAALAPIAQALGGADPASAPFTPALRDAIVEMLFRSPADLLLIPVQDVFGWPDRVNTPGTVGAENWSWKLPWPSERLLEEPDARARAATLKKLAEETGRV